MDTPISPPVARSPEVWMLAPWNALTDIWSFGMLVRHSASDIT
jgi:hypothetical protein